MNDWYENSRRKKHQIGTKIDDKAVVKCDTIQFKDGINEHKANKNVKIIILRLQNKDYAGQNQVKIWVKLEGCWEQIEKQVVKNLKELSIYMDYDEFKNAVRFV